LDPYLGRIFGIAVEVEDVYSGKFIDGVVESFTPPVLVSLVKNHYKTVKNIQNFTHFLLKSSQLLPF